MASSGLVSLLIDDQIVYAILVECGSTGQPVSDHNVAMTASWNNRRIQQFNLGLENSPIGTHHLYLTLIANR